MRRINDAVIGAGTAYGGHSGALNLAHGGQYGLMPRIGYIGSDGVNYGEYISNHAYVRRNIIPVCLSYPKGFDYLPNKEVYIRAYKNLMETLPVSIEGLRATLTVDTDSFAIGGAGNDQEEATNVTREKTTITTTVRERAGKAITKFLDFWIRYLILDPDQKIPLISKSMSTSDFNGIEYMYTPEMYTGAMLYIEPDILCKRALDAWLCVGMYPKTTGERDGARNITQAAETKELSIEWGGTITMMNENVANFADQVLGKLTILNTNPDFDMHIPVKDIDSTLQAQTDTGFNQPQKA